MQAKKPTVLAVESSTKACSVALIKDQHEFSRHEILPQKHAHRILPMIAEVMGESGSTFDDIDYLAFGEGPGAFTGIRIAAGVVQGLALGTDKPVVAISSLLAMAEALSQLKATSFKWCALLDARMNEVYVLSGSFSPEAGLLHDDTQLLSPQAAEDYLLVRQAELSSLDISENLFVGVGDIRDEYPQLMDVFDEWHDALPDALSIARLALQESVENVMKIEAQIPTPVYLRNQVADTIEQRRLKRAQKS